MYTLVSLLTMTRARHNRVPTQDLPAHQVSKDMQAIAEYAENLEKADAIEHSKVGSSSRHLESLERAR